jgi:LPS sulfotransferase NodH
MPRSVADPAAATFAKVKGVTADGGLAYEKMSESALDDARFDQPRHAARRGRAYVICTTPRSGSWLLCRQLVNAGIGVPSEYFGIDHINALYARFGVDPRDTRAYLKALRERRTTANGVFGTKLLWPQFADRRAALKVELLRDAKLVYLNRRDPAPQVVSLHLSIVTGRWGFDDATSPNRRSDIAFGDDAHLAECERLLAAQHRAWRELFAGQRLAVETMYYEDIAADQAGAVKRVAEWLGLAPSEYRVPPPEARETSFSPEIEAERRRLVEALRQRSAA